ncbi:hypothetical protein QYE76_042025 [Lolium multiflorum]|uniref:Uncharacterized protein n=1 Tax=Lolium multiflorum TaxID=4521 RepID=A0AAD8TG02_LOLMU|nr:hypothetical protein QYE76_042025 [Lolium multiflorum]
MHPVGGRSTGPQTGQAGPQAGPTGPWAGPASVPAVVSRAILATTAVVSSVSSPAVLADATAVVASWSDDVSGVRCLRGTKSGYVFNDYLDIRKGVPRPVSELKWYLRHDATIEQYEDWEKYMELGFQRCRRYKGRFTGYDTYVLAHRRVDEELDIYWCSAVDRGEYAYTWEDFKKFLRGGFGLPLEDHEQSSRVVHAMKEVDKCIVPIQEIVPLPTVTKVEVKSSEERKPGSDTKSTTVTVEEDVPLSGLNMQLKKVQDDACKTVDKVQRWSLFQTQCIVKGKACKLMIDGGSCTNGISKAMVAALGLSTWRLPEPKRLEWLNSCGMLKITHKVRVPFTVDDYVDEIDCDVLPLEVCGLLLGRPWQYDRNVTHVGRANTYSFMHGGKQRTLKPMGDDHIKSDVELVVRKEKLHKPKVQQEVHDVPSIDVGDVSAMPVDDKPVLVGDKPDEATLVVDVDVAACATVPVCVDASIQTDDVCADDISVHVAQMRVGGVGGERVSGDSGQRHYRARSTAVQFSATPRMHRGKDGRVRHLCGPGITHLVQGHVQRHKGPSKPRKKKELAPKYKLIWRRKEAPSAVSSQAGREGGCGVEGKQDLKTARTCHVHITSPFPEDPHALGTTLLEGGRMIRAWRPMWSPDSGLHQLNYLSLGNGHMWAN